MTLVLCVAHLQLTTFRHFGLVKILKHYENIDKDMFLKKYFLVQSPWLFVEVKIKKNKFTARLKEIGALVFFSAHIENIWNSLPNSVTDACTVNAFKACLDNFWQHQLLELDFTADNSLLS